MRAGFGVGRIHHVYSSRDRARLIRAALGAGMTHFDTAPAYGDGLSERELGRALGVDRGRVTIATKYGIPGRAIGLMPTPVYLGVRAAGKVLKRSFGARYEQRDFGVKELVLSLEGSLRRLGTDYVDYFLLHEPRTPEELGSAGDAWAELERQKGLGKVRGYGASTHSDLLVEAERGGKMPAGAVYMMPMNGVSCGLGGAWYASHDAFIFGIVKHLKAVLGSGEDGRGGRLETGVVVSEFYRALPSACPIFASNSLDEIARLKAALGRVRSSLASNEERR